MTTLSTTAQNPLVRALRRSGLLADDLLWRGELQLTKLAVDAFRK